MIKKIKCSSCEFGIRAYSTNSLYCGHQYRPRESGGVNLLARSRPPKWCPRMPSKPGETK